MNIWPAIFTALALGGAWLLAAMMIRGARRAGPLCVFCRRREPIEGTDECYTCWAQSHGIEVD